MSVTFLAGRHYPRVYNVVGRQDIHEFLLQSIERAGGQVLYASDYTRAPVYLGVQDGRGDRLGLLIYPFRMTRKATSGRPADEVRGQIRYGSEDTWHDQHPMGRDIAGVDITLMLGVDIEAGLLVGLQPSLYDPLPMGISFYTKAGEMDLATEHSWHVWEKENKPGRKRSVPRGPAGLETIVAFTPERLLDYARFERRATGLGLDHALRFNAAKLSAAVGETAAEGMHALEFEFDLTSAEILHIIATRNRLQVAVRGGVAEHHLQRVLEQDSWIADVKRLDQDALHDFDVVLATGHLWRLECKNASPTIYANGDMKVEVQKTRASRNDPASRYYRADQFDVVAACIYSPTGKWQFLFQLTAKLPRHPDFADRLAPMQRITPEWSKNLGGLQDTPPPTLSDPSGNT
ncbi:hypothetical protein CH253_18140 [Rhodococcus sp. 06-156-3C]|uniref:hypothetical protein n=1 Tax=Nocardiaceae TaxID=85025 RepID=UPI00068C1AB0|nr:hypothetical protein [Rhodococcus fascians]OZD12989.1 hypothetical protein CH248_27340 [Rhodococcus sp. 06-156-4a]OZD17857.1 hypothetical protein CH253_18140 [Rhodococcus sp. 06-156-3C]OZD20583.1 hypothetical protein CH280_03295 [Rhodococcus sp. 06-156-4C]OZD30699.1 hypothetical protein CH247_15435 [Rhodococcus sp. 06-156-3b]OZD32527.1 hypothetical protein CH284_19825 [Rhodococcus sp. 06-156-3]OZF65062.1 hypothetical protein CH290_10760 [Rhodococcus sp. 06-156-4]